MTDVILPIDVAIVARDLLWSVEVMNGVNDRHRDAWARDFAGIAGALEQLVPGHPTVIVAGPMGIEGVLDDYDELCRDHPEWQYVFVVGDDDLPLAQTILDRTGIEPLPAGDLDATLDEIDRALERRQIEQTESDLADAVQDMADEAHVPGEASKLVLVTSASGGAGCTTTALNLALDLVTNSGRSVTFVDGNGFKGDAAFLLRLPTPTLTSLTETKVDANSVARLIQVHEPSGLRVVVPPTGGDRLATPSPSALLNLLVALEPRSDIIVVDAPPETIHGAQLDIYADALLVVTSTRMASLKNALLVAQGLVHGPEARAVVNAPAQHLPDFDEATIEAAVGLAVAARLPYESDIAKGSVSRPPSVVPAGKSRYTTAMNALARSLYETALARPT